MLIHPIKLFYSNFLILTVDHVWNKWCYLDKYPVQLDLTNKNKKKQEH